MKYIFTKEVRANNLEEALKKEKKAPVVKVEAEPELEERKMGF